MAKDGRKMRVIRMSEELWVRVRKEAAHQTIKTGQQVSMSGVVRTAIDHYLTAQGKKRIKKGDI